MFGLGTPTVLFLTDWLTATKCRSDKVKLLLDSVVQLLLDTGLT